MGARDTLGRRRRRETRHPIWIADPTAAGARLQEAKGRLLLAGIGKEAGDPVIAALEAERDAAQAEVDACREWLVFVGLTPKEYEELLQAHPAPEGSHPDDVYNADTFIPALLAACCEDSDLTAEDWAGELQALNDAERTELTEAVMEANLTTWSSAIPKD